MSTSPPSSKPEVSTSFKTENDGKLTVYQEQDVEPYLDAAREARDRAGVAGSRYKRTFTLAAHVPDIVILQIREKHGIDATKALDTATRRRFLNIIQTEYPKLLCVPGKPFGR